MGSLLHAGDMYARGENVAAMLSLETIGYYSDAKGSQRYPPPLDALYPDTGNFIAFVGDLGTRELVRNALASFRRHARFPSEGLAAPASIPGVDWSDHWAYREHGYPAIMITDTALYRYPHYHTAQDTADKIDYALLARVVRGIELVVRDLAGGA
jgi:Zn-dependent M28 family amino/carboxypeptidase